MRPPIKGLIENSLIEWEGHIAAVVFLPGCNLRCRYCHSPHLVENHHLLEDIALERVLHCVARQRGWVDGVVISGGEPTLHDPGLRDLIHALKGIPTKVWLETNGTRPAVLQKLLQANLLDGVAMDVKAPLHPERYRRIVRDDVSTDLLRQSIQMILAKVPDHEFRVTLAPGYITVDDVVDIARSVEGASRLALQNLRPVRCLDRSLETCEPFAPEVIEEMVEKARPYVGRVIVRGMKRAAALGRMA